MTVSAIARRAQLIQMSTETRDFIRDAPFLPREETLTEVLLVELCRQLVGSRVWKATVAEERLEGHDWAWAIESANGQWGQLRVQAKKLNTSGRYEQLNHTNKSGDRQIDLLIRAAAKVDAIPVYAFYNGGFGLFASDPVHLPACELSPLTRNTRSSSSYSPLGITLADAHWVNYWLLQTPPDKTARAMNSAALPIECIFCQNINAHPKSYLRKLLGALNAPIGPAASNDVPGLTSSPPDWVERLLAGGSTDLSGNVIEPVEPDATEEERPDFYVVTRISDSDDSVDWVK